MRQALRQAGSAGQRRWLRRGRAEAKACRNVVFKEPPYLIACISECTQVIHNLREHLRRSNARGCLQQQVERVAEMMELDRNKAS